ncbi:hypothetical protein PRZ48_011656 [Zasmidium cellare]|uniref:Carboxylic ester hydrolase n=1 Tax=Zasmidium cellare TaxID=395010 RepID=A0ABR0E6Z8_ZASCE|nr:hypothetical protein PRZ48_011656 [Zasmidium cellare]
MSPRAALLFLALATGSSAAICTADAFWKAPPKVFGSEVLDIHAEEVRGWNEYATASPTFPALPVEQKPIDFCNVTIFYTHPGLNDTIRVSIWLPLQEQEWNGRFLGQGGGGWAAGGHGALAAGVALGYAAADTDAGHTYFGDMADIGLTSRSWSLTSPGNVNLHALQNFAYRALDDMAWIAKHITKTYYSKDIAYSYWNGCSTGGRQGLTLAQRYHEQFQGIISAAPAANWVTFLVTEYYAHIKMRELNYYPPICELQAITKAAIKACDELDGVKDGVISAPRLCGFDAKSIVGQKYECKEGDTRQITKEAAEVANAVWTGPLKKDGTPIWHGLAHEAPLAGQANFQGLAKTKCDSQEKNCKSDPFVISADWIKQFLLKDPDYDLSNIDEELFHNLLRISRQEYHSIMDTSDPDLTPFKEAGGKLILWHGLGDELIFPNGSLNYYERVKEATTDVEDYFRYFEVPGVLHCFGGDGAFPLTALNSLVDWVEKGKAPDHLDGQTLPMFSSKPDAEPAYRPLCAYPKVAAYKGGDVNKAESFECADGFGKVAGKRDEL